MAFLFTLLAKTKSNIDDISLTLKILKQATREMRSVIQNIVPVYPDFLQLLSIRSSYIVLRIRNQIQEGLH